MANPISYLKQLRFDPNLDSSYVASYLKNPRLVILLVMAILLIGINSFINLPRTLNPDIKIPIIIVSTILPGASPSDIESLVTIPLEDSINGVTDVKTVTSRSRDSASIIQVEFQSGVDPDKARTDVQSAVDSVILPTDVQAPKVQKINFTNAPVWSFALRSKEDFATLTRFSRTLRDDVKALPSVKDVTISGLDEQEIQIILRPEAITTYGVNPLQITAALKAAINSFPAGSVRANNSSFGLSIDPTVTSVDDIRNLHIVLGKTTVVLSDVAEIAEKAKPEEAESYIADNTNTPTRVIRFDVFKTDSADINKTAKEVEKLVNEKLMNTDGHFAVASILNTGEEIDKQFGELIRDFWITMILVFIVLFVFQGLRQAIVALLATPLTFLISFTAMKMTGIALNFISMFSLLLSLGLLVDDTIVVISAMTMYFRSKKFTPIETGLLVWRDFLIAIFTTTITTVWAFLPLLLSSGIIGEFIKTIPIVVSSTLTASFFIAMLVTLPFMIIILSPHIPRRVNLLLKILGGLLLLGIVFAVLPKGALFIFEILVLFILIVITFQVRKDLLDRTKTLAAAITKRYPVTSRFPTYVDDGVISFEHLSERYKGVLQRILLSQSARRKTITMVVIFSLFAYMLLPLGFVRNEFFPKSDADILYVNLELPSGTNFEKARDESITFLDKLRMTPESRYVTADLGKSISMTDGQQATGEINNTIFSISLIPKGRKTSSIDLATKLREQYQNYTSGKVSIIEESGGPPAGSDVQINLFGDDLTKLDIYAGNIQDYLKSQPKITNVDQSVKSGTSKLVFIPDGVKLAESGITQDQLGLWLRILASGLTADSVKFDSNGNEKQDITIRTQELSPTADQLDSLEIPTMTGNLVPLSSLGEVRLAANPTQITREDGKRTLSVSASVEQGGSVSEANAHLLKFADEKLNLPSGYSYKTGGVNEENQNSVNSILQAMLLSFLLIIITMVLQFSSFRKALIVMLVIPLSIAGVFIIFALTHTPLSFPALIGVLALFGIVVKNSILVVDKITQNVNHGMDFVPSIVDGAGSRMEAIALTSIATIMGLIPITLSDPLWRGLGGAIIAGLTFSGTIMLFFIPLVYYYWFHPKPSNK